jgi:hypothetical protein
VKEEYGRQEPGVRIQENNTGRTQKTGVRRKRIKDKG